MNDVQLTFLPNLWCLCVHCFPLTLPSCYLPAHLIGHLCMSRASIGCQSWQNTEFFSSCSCNMPNPSSWSTPDLLWSNTHKATWGCLLMECWYFNLVGSHKWQRSRACHLWSPCCCCHWLVAQGGHRHLLPCQMLQRPTIWKVQTFCISAGDLNHSWYLYNHAYLCMIISEYPAL